MANSLEKRDYREQPAMHAIEATEWAAGGTGFLVPGIRIDVAGREHSPFQHRTTQPGAKRASQPWAAADAQYDLWQAPPCLVALGFRQTKRPDKRSSEHARYLYEVLGTTWKTGHKATH